LYRDLFKDLADNVCKPCVDALADRLTISNDGFNADDGLDEVNEIWRDIRGPELGNVVHLQAIKKGDVYVVVWPGSDGQPDLAANEAETIQAHYDPADRRRLLFVSKRWNVEIEDALGKREAVRVTLYFPDRVEKYINKSTATVRTQQGQGRYQGVDAWEPITDEDNEPWPIPHPYGVVPVVHFPYNAGGDVFGTSRMAPAIPLQKAINTFWCLLVGAADMAAIPQKYIFGVTSPAGGWQSGPDRVWEADESGPDVKLGSFETADIEKLIASIKLGVERVATNTKTPLYMLQGTQEPPAGVAVKAVEGPLVADAKTTQVSFGNRWEDAMRLAVAVKRNVAVSQVKGRIEPIWEPVEFKNEKEEAEVVKILGEAGLPLRERLERMGYASDDIDRILEAQAVDKAAADALGAQIINDRLQQMERQ